jgi:Phage phiEco32-like COOH.NH2 ligase-type 2
MPITVGCDPEFLVISADDINYTENAVFLNNVGPFGEIGTDHGGTVGELRPRAGSPANVTDNIRSMFREMKGKLGNRKIVAGGGQKFGKSIGGHIHIGGIIFSHGYCSPTRQSNRGRVRPLQVNTANPEHKLIFMLDYYLGRRLKKVNGGSRSGGSYGRLSDIETKNHGFEYRTPPSWLTDPILTEATLAIAHQIATMWQAQHTVFDSIIQKGKGIARKKDYNLLIPTDMAQKVYMTKQVANFKKIVFSKTYDMANVNCVNLWTDQNALNQAYNIQSAIAATTTEAPLTERTINLVVCQLKLVNFSSDFQDERVLKVCRFGMPEVKIYPMGEYTPWALQLERNIRLRPNVIYISKEMRKFLKVKRGHNFKIRFLQMNRRTTTTGASHQFSNLAPMQNAIIFNSASGVDVTAIQEEIIRIIETGARKKLRREA